MATLPISAYYYFPKEKALILENVTPISETEAYIFGTIETSKIALLKKHSILMDFHQDPSKMTAGIPRSIGASLTGRRSVQLRSVTKMETPYPQTTQLYLIQLMGPLLPAWKTELTKNHVALRELMQYNAYKVKTNEPKVFEALKFITDYRPFAMVDKELVLQRSVSSYFDLFASQSIVVGLYDIRLHRDASIDAFLSFLKAHKISILEQSGRKFRVRIKKEEVLILLGRHEAVYGVEEYVKPVLHNYLARESLHIDVAEEDRFLIDSSLTGAGEIVGVADTGIDADHPDLKERILKVTAWGRHNDTSDPNGHGTHVSGSIVGNGSCSEGKIKGMAPEAQLFFQSLLDDNGGISGIPHDLAELFQEAYDAGVRVHNNSWGSATESEYRFNSLEVDEFVHTHRDMLLVISAGNEGTAFSPRNSNPGFVDWLSLGSPATAKNALCVGASRSARTQGGFSKLTHGMAWPDKYPEQPIKDFLISGDTEGMAGFSSRGPCGNESRIKPDVVAPGTDIASTRSAQAPTSNFWGPYPKNRKYAFMGGT
ncbi:MAG TPA: S8 family serine peptidase, partial [Pricia sp.]|nr:S8 family serine peptidase [Pricia sp.]